MLRSMYAGVSGLTANMAELDVIGNNIANSNTVGFKGSRVTFQEMLTQTLRPATRPSTGGRGGTNPQQIGLGALVGSIGSDFAQGDLRSTGLKTDLAIQGRGFFVLSDGSSSVYSRAGAFGLDSDYYLVDPSTGLKVQGRLADAEGVIQPGALQDLYIDPSAVMPAAASTSVQMFGNLNADSDALGTELVSPVFLARASGADALIGLHGQDGADLSLVEGDRLSATGYFDGTLFNPGQFQVGASDPLLGGDSLADLASWLTSRFQTAGHDVTFAVDGATGALTAANNSGATLTNLQLSSGTRVSFNQNMGFDATIADGASGTTRELRAPATADDQLTSIYNLDGDLLNLTPGTSVLELSGTRGDAVVTPGQLTVAADTTLGDLLTTLQSTFNITGTPVTVDENGCIDVTGDVGTSNAIGELSIREVSTSNSALETAMNFTQTQQARDASDYSVATTVYDSLGNTHTVRFTFQKEAGLNEWTWAAAAEGDEEITSGGSGRIRFTDSGLISSFTFNDGSSGLTFLPQPTGTEGAEPVTAALDFGDIGGLNGMTQFAASSSLESLADGYTVGSLVDYEIDQQGVIVGRFSNDTMRNLGQIAIAQFSNPEGLTRGASNTFSASGNSGEPLTTFADATSGISLAPGTLESSNVDLAEQFTRLVVAQRAFQANARVITTGDQILQELVSILR
ncbi:MAG: flagellar hook-basal body complex protein [Candidatus Krumholzibacteriia bacterium]